jgi:hypothetical protein
MGLAAIVVGTVIGLAWPLILVMISACELMAFALRRRESVDEPRDGTDVTVRLVSGAVFGIVGAPLAAWSWGWSGSRLEYAVLAIAGGTTCAILAVRFGHQFWQWVFFDRRSPF